MTAGPTVAVGAVIVSRNRLLLVRRANPPELGRWSIPGGRVETGEIPAAAVERGEVMEETGLRVECGRFLGWVERLSPSHHFVILDFEAQPVGPPGTLRAGSDASDAAWIGRREVPGLELVAGLADFLAAHDVIAAAQDG